MRGATCAVAKPKSSASHTRTPLTCRPPAPMHANTQDDATCELRTQAFLAAIDTAATLPGQGFAAIKLTALGDPALLVRACLRAPVCCSCVRSWRPLTRCTCFLRPTAHTVCVSFTDSRNRRPRLVPCHAPCRTTVTEVVTVLCCRTSALPYVLQELLASALDAVKALFRRYDSNGDGFVTRQGFLEAFERIEKAQGEGPLACVRPARSTSAVCAARILVS